MLDGSSAASKVRYQTLARREAKAAYPYECCVICGLKMCLQVAHLDHDAGNNGRDNLAWLCPTHHGMFDSGLYPLDTIKQLRAHWQATKGEQCHKARMKNAGSKAARTRKLSAAAFKAWATRRASKRPGELP